MSSSLNKDIIIIVIIIMSYEMWVPKYVVSLSTIMQAFRVFAISEDTQKSTITKHSPPETPKEGEMRNK